MHRNPGFSLGMTQLLDIMMNMSVQGFTSWSYIKFPMVQRLVFSRFDKVVFL